MVLEALEPLPFCRLKLTIAVPAKAADGTKRIENGPIILARPAEAGVTEPRTAWVNGPPVAPWVRSTVADWPAARIWLEAGTLIATAAMVIE